jgi:hypothetical protein
VGQMDRLKKVYLFIGVTIVLIALIDLFYITKYRYEIVLNASFYLRFFLMASIFVVGIRLIRKIDHIFVDQLLEMNMLKSTEEVLEDYRDLAIEKHEITRKLQIIQSYAKMKRYDDLELFLNQEIEKEK